MELKKYNQFNIIVMAMIVVLIMLGVVYNGIFSTAAFVLVCGYFALSSAEIIIADMFFLLPFATVFKPSPASTSFVSILLIAVIIIFMLRKKGKLKNTLFFMTGMIFAIFIVLVDMIQGSISIASILRNLFGILFVYYLIEIEDKSILEQVIIAFGIGVFITSVIALFASDIPNFYVYVRKVGYNLLVRNRFSGMNGDPNYYTIGLILVLYGALLIYEKRKLYFWGALFFTFFFGVQTYSKSFLIVFSVTLVLIFVDLIKNKNSKFMAVLFLIVIGVGTYLVFSGYFSAIDFIIGRITTSNSLSEFTTGRSDIWDEYLRHIFNNGPLKIMFGEGLSAPLLNEKGSHNFYIELLYYFGIIGWTMFATMFIIGYRSVSKGSKGFTAGKAGIVMLLMMYFNLQMVASNELYFHIAYIFLICKYDDQSLLKRLVEVKDEI